MVKMEDVYRSPGRDCRRCGGHGVLDEGTKANPQEKSCPDCNPNKGRRPFL